MSRSVSRSPAKRPAPQRNKLSSQRGVPSAGNTFRNASIVSVANSSSESGAFTLDVTLDQRVSLKGLTGWTFLATATVRPITAASLVEPNVLRFTFAAAVTGTTSVVVPENDEAIRTQTGGWVNAGTTGITLS